MKHFYQEVSGWFFAEEIFADAVSGAVDGAHFVEVGSWKGKSAAFMAVEIANSGKKISFDCIDHWLGSKNNNEGHAKDEDIINGKLFERFNKNVEQAAAFIKTVKMDSVAAAALYKDASLDFIYIDGTHDYVSVAADIKAWLPKLKPNGMIAGDDYTQSFPGVVRAVNEIFGSEVVTKSPCWVVDRRAGERKPIYRIIMRTHSGSSVHDGKRVVDADKAEIVVRCLRSLVASLNTAEGDIRLTVMDDHSAPSCIERMKKVLAASKHSSSLVSLESVGNAASIKASFEFLRDNACDAFYIVEDDYLHARSAIGEMIEAYETFRKNLGGGEAALFPVDYPDRYKSHEIYESMLVLGKSRHWRTVKHSTYTFMLSRAAMLSHWDALERGWMSPSGFIDEDGSVNALWHGPVLLFSPIPSLAFHLQFKEHMPPFAEWKELWDSNAGGHSSIEG